MDIPQKIDQIIAERKKRLPETAAALERAVNAKKLIEQLDRFRNIPPEGAAGAVQSMVQANPEFAEKLQAISTQEFYEKYMSAERALRDLQRRFSRDELHISFVGRAGQGKSLILQRISGLPGSIIPSAEGGDCTGAKSVISNGPGEETRAKITFYTEQEFVGIVNKYLEKIFKTGEYSVFSLDGVIRLKDRMQELDARVDYTQVREQSLLRHLKKYVGHAEGLRKRLGSEITVPEAEIESYVAQYKSEDTACKYYDYLGVKEARIISSFPCTQCGKIVLEDTIGTGATSLGVDEAMLKTVKQDSDVIVYMMRPEPLRSRVTKEDYDMIADIAGAVTPEYAKQMLFWIVNRVEDGKGRNAGQVPEIMEQLRETDLPAARYLDVNCWKQDEVESGFLLPVLNHMSEHLAEIDNLLLNRANKYLRDLEAAYRKISSRVEGAAGASISSNERRVLGEKYIDPAIKRMTNEIRNLYHTYGERREESCARLENAANIKLKNILKRVPRDDDILPLLHDGTMDPNDALKALGEKIRIQIIDDFLDLNPTLHETVMDMKKAVVHQLAAEDAGRLGFITAETDNPEEWLDAMQDKLKDVPEYQTICGTLRPLREFDLRMENFLIYKVRSCLDPIDWSCSRPPAIKELEDNPHKKPDDTRLVKEFQAIFRHILQSVHDAVREELGNYYVFPNEALFAVVRDFYDRIVKSGNRSGDVQREWRYLYEDMLPVIWPQEYHGFRKNQDAQKEWGDFTANIRACAGGSYFLIQ